MIEQLVVGPMATNAWIVPLPAEGARKKHCILVDPGGDADIIIARLEALKLRPSLVVLTHGHFDHLQALGEVVQKYAQDDWTVDIAIHSGDIDHTGPKSQDTHRRDFARVGGQAFIAQYWRDVPLATRQLADGDPVGPFVVLSVPGHRPGCIALWDKKKKILISGDCLFKRGVGRTDLPGGDERALRASLHRLLDLPAATLVLPGHGDTTTIGSEADWLGF